MLIENGLLEKIHSWADAHADEMREELREFAKIRSVSRADLAAPGEPFGPDCRKMLEHALSRAKAYGFDCDDNGGWYGDAWLGERKNAIGIIGHLDVVPEGEGWQYPPYAATRLGDFLIGRGVSDNKSACVLGLYCMRMLRDIEAPLTNGVRAIFGLSEETGMADMRRMVSENAQPPLSLVPDAAFPVNYAQKGTLRGESSIALGSSIALFEGGEVRNMVPPEAKAVLRGDGAQMRDALGEGFECSETPEGLEVTAKGAAAHAASPENGVSAIYLLSSALAELPSLDEKSRAAMLAVSDMCSDFYGQNAGIACEDPETGKTTMVCGVARTKDGRLSLSLDCRLSIASDLEAVKAAYRAYAEGLGFRVDDLEAGEPFYIEKSDPRVQILLNVCRELGGIEGEPYTMGGGTYSRVVPNAITFGPSNRLRGEKMELPKGHGGAHQPDEYLYFPNLVEALKLFACAVILLDRLV